MVARDGDQVTRRIALLDYDILIAPGLFASAAAEVTRVAPAHRYAVVTDATVAALHLAPLRAALDLAARAPTVVATFPAGEASKTRESWAAVTDHLLQEGCGRDTAVIALGGGVVGDLAGFVAATYMRGIPWVQIPTTLLAMVDASIGGKTGVDVPAGKNLVGAFHQPAAVLVDPMLLRTLPERERRNGLAEVVKHGIIASAAHLDDALSAAPSLLDGDRDTADFWPLIADSIAIKADVVARDEREGGVRKVLNFGHTVGHAVEAASGFRLMHGECVAIGMVIEARLAERLGVAERGTAEAVEGAVRAVGLPVAIPSRLEPDALVTLMRADKKARQGRLVFALPSRVGAMAGEHAGWSIDVDEAPVLDALRTGRAG